MNPQIGIEEPVVGSEDWRAAAEGVLARAREVSRRADERVRWARGQRMATSQRPAVLVVDDEPMVRCTLGAMLAHLGYVVLEAADGFTAVEGLRGASPVVVAAVLDVRMPGMDGPATFEALRALEPGLPCVFLSGDTGGYAVTELLARGAVGVLTKPVRLAALGAALRAAVGSAVPDGDGR